MTTSSIPLLPLRIRKFAKTLGLRALILCKSLLPNSFITSVFSRLTNVRLVLKDAEKGEGEVTLCKYKHGAKGALCISIDFDFPISRKLKVNWREATIKILRLTEKHSIPISWGICGVLALNESKTLKQIIRSAVPHDFGVHTFSHTDLSSPKCTYDVARDEIMKCIGVLKDVKKPATFIFPWNRQGHLSLLKELGFITYRGNNAGKLAYPSKVQELWDVHGTYYLTEKSVSEFQALLGLIDSAISYGCVLHLWSHPWSMSVNGSVKDFIDGFLDPMVGYAAQKEKDGLLWICTMRELANYCEAREVCHVENLEKMEDKIGFSVHCTIKDPRYVYDFPPSVTLQIRIPERWREITVFVDDIKQEFSPSCFIAKSSLKSSLFLTLSFENSPREVNVIKTE